MVPCEGCSLRLPSGARGKRARRLHRHLRHAEKRACLRCAGCAADFAPEEHPRAQHHSRTVCAGSTIRRVQLSFSYVALIPCDSCEYQTASPLHLRAHVRSQGHSLNDLVRARMQQLIVSEQRGETVNVYDDTILSQHTSQPQSMPRGQKRTHTSVREEAGQAQKKSRSEEEDPDKSQPSFDVVTSVVVRKVTEKGSDREAGERTMGDDKDCDKEKEEEGEEEEAEAWWYKETLTEDMRSMGLEEVVKRRCALLYFGLEDEPTPFELESRGRRMDELLRGAWLAGRRDRVGRDDYAQFLRVNGLVGSGCPATHVEEVINLDE